MFPIINWPLSLSQCMLTAHVLGENRESVKTVYSVSLGSAAYLHSMSGKHEPLPHSQVYHVCLCVSACVCVRVCSNIKHKQASS